MSSAAVELAGVDEHEQRARPTREAKQVDVVVTAHPFPPPDQQQTTEHPQKLEEPLSPRTQDEKDKFWEEAKKAGLDQEEIEREKKLKKGKLIIDIMIPTIMVILVVIADSNMSPALSNPGDCSKTKANDFACFQLGTLNASYSWNSSSGLTVVDSSKIKISTIDGLPFSQTTRVCQLSVLEATSKTSQSWEYRTLSDGWKCVLGLIPLVLVFQGILSLNLSSRLVAPGTLFFTILLGLNFFRDAKSFANDTLPQAMGKVALVIADRFFWTIFEYALNVFAAFFFLRVLELWGIVDAMRLEFDRLAPNANRKLVLVGYAFAIALAVVAPGGSNFVIAGSILIHMNLTKSPEGSPERKEANIRIGCIALFGNALVSAFNLLGVCITTLAEDISELDKNGMSAADGEYEISRLFAAQFLVFATVAPVIMLLVFNQKKGLINKLKDISPDVPISLFVGLVFSITQYVVGRLMGPKLPCLLSGGLSILAYLLVEHQKNLKCLLPTREAIEERRYLLPLILLIVVLVLYGVVPGAEATLTAAGASAENVLNPTIFKVNSGGVYIKKTFGWLYHSGVVVFIIAIATPFLVPYRKAIDPELTQQAGFGVENGFAESMDRDPNLWRKHVKLLMLSTRAKTCFVPDSLRRRKVLKTAWDESVADAVPVVISITAFASIAKLMSSFGMTTAIASQIVNALSSVPAVYAFFMPVIGMLGSGLTGSTTTSNFLFARLQVKTTDSLGLLNGKNSIWEVAGLQVLGSSAGEIISPMNAVVITLMDGVGASESELCGRLLGVTGVWLFFTMLSSLTFLLAPGLD